MTLLVTDDWSQSQHQTLTVKYPVRSLDMIGMTQYITHTRYKFCDQFTLPPMMECKGLKHPWDTKNEVEFLRAGRASLVHRMNWCPSAVQIAINLFFKTWFEVSR